MKAFPLTPLIGAPAHPTLITAWFAACKLNRVLNI